MTLRAIRDEFCRYISCRWFDLSQNKTKVTLYVFLLRKHQNKFTVVVEFTNPRSWTAYESYTIDPPSKRPN